MDTVLYGSTFTREAPGTLLGIERVDPYDVIIEPKPNIYDGREIVAQDWTPKTIKAPPSGFKFSRA